MDQLRINIIFPLPVHSSPTSEIILTSEHILHLNIREENPENTAHAKNPSCAADPNKDTKRRGPRYPMISKPSAQNANADKYVSFTEDTHQDISDDAGFQSDEEKEEELEEE
eukprot:15358404-Ditylum_brightwellii.AAC.2